MLKTGHNYIKIDDKKVHFYVQGKGKIIIFIHGWGADWIQEEIDSVKSLNKYFRSIFVELPGSGDSDPLEIKHTIKNYSDFLYNFIGKLKLCKVYLVGHSMGALIAIQ